MTAVDALAEAVAGLATDGAPLRLRDCRPLAYGSSYPLLELAVETAGGAPRRLVLKDLGGGGRADAGWRVKPAFLRDPRREITVYREVLAPHGVAAPAFLGAAVSPRRGRCWLFLELVDGAPLWQHGELTAWERAAAWLARVHAQFAGRTELPRRLLALDGRYHRRWLERSRRLAPWPGGAGGRAFAQVAARAETALAWLAAQPTTFLHGEPYPANLLVRGAVGAGGGDGAGDVVGVDWEMAGVGAGLLDLAALAGGAWDDGRRAALAAAYREALPRRLRPTAAALRDGLRHARLLRAVQWLGWSAAWAPPAEHRHDWLAEALALAGVPAPPPVAPPRPTSGPKSSRAARPAGAPPPAREGSVE